MIIWYDINKKESGVFDENFIYPSNRCLDNMEDLLIYMEVV